ITARRPEYGRQGQRACDQCAHGFACTAHEEIAMHDTFRNGIALLLFSIVILVASVGAMAAGPKAYVGNFSDSTVTVIDTTSGSVIATLPVSTGPHGM